MYGYDKQKINYKGLDGPKEVFMAGGQRMDDHGFWAGAKGKSSVFPDGPHKTKDESSAEGSGHIAYYEDTTEAIKKVQMDSNKKIKSHPMKTSNFH